ncbi:MAG: FecR domain-containing protein [Spirochaetes bacterium]|nr:FecR domain-containing protein [Spirochaetota bacterium]
MKEKEKRLLIIAVRLFTVFAVVLIFAIKAYSAQISFMAGDVKVIKKGKASAAQFQMTLYSGDILKTGKGAFADILYEDGSVIKIKENSSIIVGNKSAKGSDSLSVTSGIISAKFAKLQKDSARRVYTPTTVCAIRGTEFEVAVSDSADSKIQLSEGALQLLNPYGKLDIEGDEGAEVVVAEAPAEAGNGELVQWKNEQENQLDKNPEQKADAFSQYVKDFRKRSESASKNISNLEKKRSTVIKGGKDKLDKANKDLDNIENDVENDLYMNNAANNSIDGILSRFRNDKKGMYDKFLKVKAESNKVMDQQKKNFTAIAAVKEAYRKAYDDILKKHKEGIDKIKGGFDKESVKPKK